MFSGGFYIYIRTNGSFYTAVFGLKSFDILPDQYQNVTVDAAAFIICHISDFIKHFFFNSD